MTVTGKLNPIVKAGAEIVNKPYGAFTITSADKMGNDQLGIDINSRLCPSIAGAVRSGLGMGYVLLLCIGE